jgi:hypothetical protein
MQPIHGLSFSFEVVNLFRLRTIQHPARWHLLAGHPGPTLGAGTIQAALTRDMRFPVPTLWADAITAWAGTGLVSAASVPTPARTLTASLSSTSTPAPENLVVHLLILFGQAVLAVANTACRQITSPTLQYAYGRLPIVLSASPHQTSEPEESLPV